MRLDRHASLNFRIFGRVPPQSRTEKFYIEQDRPSGPGARLLGSVELNVRQVLGDRTRSVAGNSGVQWSLGPRQPLTVCGGSHIGRIDCEHNL